MENTKPKAARALFSKPKAKKKEKEPSVSDDIEDVEEEDIDGDSIDPESERSEEDEEPSEALREFMNASELSVGEAGHDEELGMHRRLNLSQDSISSIRGGQETSQDRRNRAVVTPWQEPMESTFTDTAPFAGANAVVANPADDVVYTLEEHGVAPINGNGRLHSRHLSITIPRINENNSFGSFIPTDVIGRIFGFFNNSANSRPRVLRVSLNGEYHLDGSPHAHLYIELAAFQKNGKNATPNVQWTDLDKIFGKRGNYQVTRDVGKWMKYCLKSVTEGKSMPFAGIHVTSWTPNRVDFDPFSLVKEKQHRGVMGEVARAIIRSPTRLLEHLDELNAHGLLLSHNRALPDLVTWSLQKKAVSRYPSSGDIPQLPILCSPICSGHSHRSSIDSIEDICQLTLYKVINRVARGMAKTRESCLEEKIPFLGLPSKQNLVYVYGKTNMRKSSLFQHVNKSIMSCVTVDFNADFPFNGLNANFFPDCIVVENLNGEGISFKQFEAFVDMEPNRVFNHKGSSFMSPHRALVVILANRPWYTLWRIPRESFLAEITSESYVFHPDHWFDQLAPEYRLALDARLWHIFHIVSPLTGFPDPNIQPGVVDLS